MKGTPRSRQFDDIYFSAQNGLEETHHVFLNGNNLPQAWENRDQFTIAETGFGTGLNFLAAWKLFDDTAVNGQTLDFISVEKYPLTPQEIKEALEPWADDFGTRIDDMLAHYPIRINGFHRLKLSPKITLTLMFDDVNDAFPKLDAVVDCWFLDGFTPAKNPDMWSETVFREMARLSRNGASFSSFTAASDVRSGLGAVGFVVSKQRGFSYKRNMIAGYYDGKGASDKKTLKCGAKIAIVGGGLAGTACAYVLKQYGFTPVIYEQADRLASGASGNEVGLFNPRFSKLRDGAAEFFASAYAQFLNEARKAGEAVEYRACGSLHLMNSADKKERLESMLTQWGWLEDHVKILSAEDASQIAGININTEALYLPDAGTVSPEKMCHYYARDIEVIYNHKVEDLDALDADAVILANAAAMTDFIPQTSLPINKVRGQVTKIQASEVSKNLKCNLCYGGYISPARAGDHMIGATFEKWIDHTDVTEDNHEININMLKENISALADENFKIIDGRAAMRAASNDRFPVVGRMPDTADMILPIYVASAFGSQGLLSSLVAAHLLADLLRGGPLSLPIETVKWLFPQRFFDRAKKKGRVLN